MSQIAEAVPTGSAGVRQRVLIDWDYGAHGVWRILSAQELAAPAPSGKWSRGDQLVARTEQPRPWSHVLSVDLLDALQDWNDRGPTVFGGPGGPRDPTKEDAFYRDAEDLAGRTQRELGAGYEVLFKTPDGAWRWIDPPYHRP